MHFGKIQTQTNARKEKSMYHNDSIECPGYLFSFGSSGEGIYWRGAFVKDAVLISL